MAVVNLIDNRQDHKFQLFAEVLEMPAVVDQHWPEKKELEPRPSVVQECIIKAK